MDSAQWQQDARYNGNYNQVQERKVKPENEDALNCPRCNSTNTKFCYYNNYSLTQPRYYCKACKRYWTKGGSLRSVPVGGASRKNKRSTPKPVDLSQFSSQNLITHQGQDLNLGFHATQEDYHHGFSQFLKLPKIENSNTSSAMALDLLRTGTTCDGSNSFINTTFNGTRFSLQDLKPFQENQDSERIMLPFDSSREIGQNMGHGSSTGYWTETLGGGLSTLYN